MKAIRENKEYDLSKGFRKIFVFLRILMFYFFLTSFLNATTNGNFWCASLLFPYRKKDLSELLLEDNPNENGFVTLDDFIISLKIRFTKTYI